MATEQDMLDALIQHQVYTHRASTTVVNELTKQFTATTNNLSSRLRELLDELTDAEKEAFRLGKYTTDTLKEVKEIFDEMYLSIAITMPETFAVSAIALATYEATYMSKLYGKDIELSGEKVFKKAKSTPIVGGKLYSEVWKNLATKTREDAIYKVREGIDSGLTTAQIVSEIKGKRTKVGDKYEYVGGIVDDTKNSIDASVRTIRSHVANTAYQDIFEALGAEYFKFLATLDFRTTKNCGSLDGKVWEKDDPNLRRPPLHYRCRSVLIMVEKDGNIGGERPFVASNKPVSKIPKDQRAGIIGQVDANETFSSWLKRQPDSFQLDYLGETKYKLYKDGGFSLDRFVDPLGKEYSIKELRALDEKTFRELNL